MSTRRLARETLYQDNDDYVYTSWASSQAAPGPTGDQEADEPVNTEEDYLQPVDHRYELCALLAEFAPKVLGDLLKTLVWNKHGGRTVKELLDYPEFRATADLLRKPGYLTHYNSEYYLLPLDARGKVDKRRDGANDYLDQVATGAETYGPATSTSGAYGQFGQNEHHEASVLQVQPSRVQPSRDQPRDQPHRLPRYELSQKYGVVMRKKTTSPSYNSDYDKNVYQGSATNNNAHYSPGLYAGTTQYEEGGDFFSGPTMSRGDMRGRAEERYVTTQEKQRYSMQVYEDLKKPTVDEREIAVTYFLLRECEMSGLVPPKEGWYNMPNDNDQSFESHICRVIHMTTNVSEILDLSSKAILETLKLLKAALKAVCEKLDSQFRSRDRLVYALSWSLGRSFDNDAEKMNTQLNMLHGVAVADSALKSSEMESEYDALLRQEPAEVYEEIIEDIYEEVEQEIYKSLEPDVPKEEMSKNTQPNKLQKIGELNQDLIQRTITLSTVVQQSEEKISDQAMKEVGIVTKSLHKAKEVVVKIVEVIKEEIKRVKDKIAEKRRQKQVAKQEREAAARQQGRPLPAIPVEEPEDRELEKEVARLNKLEEKQAENNELYSRLDAVDDMLEELVTKRDKGYFEMMIERNGNILKQNFTLNKDGLIVSNILSNKEWKEVNKGKKKIDKVQLFLKILLKKGDYTCSRFVDYLRTNMKNVYNELLKAEDRWRNASLTELLSDQTHTINWDKAIDTVDVNMALNILKMYSVLTANEFEQVRTAIGVHRKGLLKEILAGHGQEDWDLFMGGIQHQETTMKTMYSTWDENDRLANWQVLMETLDNNLVCTILFSRYIITPRQYADVTSRMTLSEKHEMLEKILCHKGKDDWIIFIYSLKDRGQGHVMETLIHEQEKKKHAKDDDENLPKVEGRFLSYSLLRSVDISREAIRDFIYDHRTKQLYIESKAKQLQIDAAGKSKPKEMKMPPKGWPLTIDTKRKLILYGQHEKVMGIRLEGKSKPEVLVDDSGRGTRVTGVTYDQINDLYQIIYEGQPGVTFYDPNRKYIVRTIGKQQQERVLSIVTCPANQILVRSKSYLTVYTIRGEVNVRHKLGYGGVNVEGVSGVTADHLRRVLVADPRRQRIARVHPNHRYEYTPALGRKPTALLAGLDGTLFLGNNNGKLNVYGDKPPEGDATTVDDVKDIDDVIKRRETKRRELSTDL